MNLMRTHEAISSAFEHFFKEHGISSSLYNVMRILRGAEHGDAMTGEIKERLLHRVPDVTRLVDRLEGLGFARRRRARTDRRIVHVILTKKGRDKLEELDDPVLQLHRTLVGHMSSSQLRDFINLLEVARQRRDVKGGALT